jgi:DNA-binding response OmpR family regulator
VTDGHDIGLQNVSEPPIILVVDDDGPILELMKNLLREYGFQAVTASTGDQAIGEFRRRRPALVLLDKNMPEMSGDEVIRALRAEPAPAPVPILILSGEPISRSELEALGADGAVQKPFDIPALIAQIRRHLGAGPEPRAVDRDPL